MRVVVEVVFRGQHKVRALMVMQGPQPVSIDQILIGQDFLRFSKSHDSPGGQNDVVSGSGLLEIVCGQDNRATPRRLFVNERVNCFGGVKVQTGKWFIEQENRVILGDSLGDIHPLPLPTGKFSEMPFGEICYFQPVHGGCDNFLVTLGEATE